MILLSTFVSSHLIPALESALAEHEPALQAMLVTERQNAWVPGLMKKQKSISRSNDAIN